MSTTLERGEHGVDMGAAWRQHAACTGMPMSWFFPERGGTYDNARAVCSNCDVRSPCLAETLTFEQPGHRYGLAGGLTPDERARLPRARLPRARLPRVRTHGTVAEYGRGCRCDACRDARARYAAERYRTPHQRPAQPVRVRLRRATGASAP